MIVLPKLEFEINNLNPLISEKTVSFHYGKHHQGYVNKLNAIIPDLDKDFDTYDVEQILLNIDKVQDAKKTSVFNNAGQIFNHNLYWKSVSGNSSAVDLKENDLMTKISDTFGSIEKFIDAWKKEGLGIFGSGWLWLVSDEEGNLSIEKTFNADTPFIRGKKCLMVMDVWEHAYYLDYQNDRASYIDSFIKLIDWESANKRYIN